MTFGELFQEEYFRGSPAGIVFQEEYFRESPAGIVFQGESMGGRLSGIIFQERQESQAGIMFCAFSGTLWEHSRKCL